MKVRIQSKVETIHTVAKDIDMLRLIWSHKHAFTAENIIEYLERYHPELHYPMDVDYHHLAFYLASERCILPENVCVRVLEYILDAYSFDVNSVSFRGSPLVMYAIQSLRTSIVDLLVAKGARLTQDGHGIKNINSAFDHIDIPFCVKADDKMQKCVAAHIYNELVKSK